MNNSHWNEKFFLMLGEVLLMKSAYGVWLNIQEVIALYSFCLHEREERTADENNFIYFFLVRFFVKRSAQRTQKLFKKRLARNFVHSPGRCIIKFTKILCRSLKKVKLSFQRQKQSNNSPFLIDFFVENLLILNVAFCSSDNRLEFEKHNIIALKTEVGLPAFLVTYNENYEFNILELK